jgi:prevent-host-death family protein
MGDVVVNLYEAKTHLSDLVERAARGEAIVIAKAGVPKCRLTAMAARPRRKPGGWEGKVRIGDDFDAPLPPEIEEAFAGLRP